MYKNLRAEMARHDINGMYDAQKSAQLAQLKASRDKAVGSINTQKQELIPQYQGLRNQSDVVAMQNAQRLKEQMAASGLLASGENVSAQTSLAAARQNALNGLNTQQQQQTNQLDQRIADLNNPASQEALTQALEAQRAQAMINAGYQADNRAYQTWRDTVGDNRWNTQFDYQKSRDQVGDNRWNTQFDYQKSRDQVGDNRWNTQFNYQKAQDSVNNSFRDKQFSESQRQFNAQVEQRAQQFASQLGLDWARLNQSEQQSLRSSALQEQQFQLSRDKYYNDQQRSAQSETAKQATQSAIAQAMTYPDADSAYKALQQYGPQMQAQGVDLGAVLDIITQRFGRQQAPNPYLR